MTDTAGKERIKYALRLMEEDVLKFKAYAEDLVLPQKCAPKVSEECERASYDACVSELPSPQCPGGIEFSAEACGDGTKCGAIYDFNASVLRLAPGSFDPFNGEPTDKVSFDIPLKEPSIHFLSSPLRWDPTTRISGTEGS
jgi:hypothetical protein